MALKGNLRDFSITQLLNLINLAHKTGTLAIEGPKDTAWVSFRKGKLAYSLYIQILRIIPIPRPHTRITTPACRQAMPPKLHSPFFSFRKL